MLDYYYKARIYSPTLGRFLQVDPIGYRDQQNLYAYVGNDPIDGRDPMGENAILVTRSDGSTRIIVPIQVVGPAARPESGNQIADVVRNWTVDVPNVTIEVVVSNVPVQGVLNIITIGNGPNTSMCGAAGECTNSVGGNRAYINADNAQHIEAAAHDIVGHGAGMTDQYVEGPRDASGNRTSSVAPGSTADNVMATRAGNLVSSTQINEVRNNPTTVRRCENERGIVGRC